MSSFEPIHTMDFYLFVFRIQYSSTMTKNGSLILVKLKQNKIKVTDKLQNKMQFQLYRN